MLPRFSWVRSGVIAGLGRPGGLRPLPDDVAELAEQGVRLLVSMTPHAPERSVVEAGGLELCHLPVVDFDAPTQEQIDTFVEIATLTVSEGGAIAVHCAAGLGRAGTMIAVYLVAAGETASAAIAEVRRARPGSIESSIQRAAIARFASRRPPSPESRGS